MTTPPNAPASKRAPQSNARDWYRYGKKADVSWVTRFLWRCAGADEQILLRCPNSDRVKFQGLGGVVLTVGVLAFLSGSYAFYTVFSPKDVTALGGAVVHWPSVAAAVFFGGVWGLIIFNIDRFIISSTGKGDGTERITWSEFTNALPRLAMAVVIGLCMSKPLEIRILKSEIDSELEREQKTFLAELNDKSENLVVAERKRLREKIDGLHEQIDTVDGKLEKRRIEINHQREKLELEAEGKTGTGTPGRGPAWRDKKQNLDRMDAELNRDRQALGKKTTLWTDELTEAKTSLADLDKHLAEEKISNAAAARHLDGLMKRIQISHDIGGWIPWAILLLLLCIEAGPIFFKLMVIKGPYDYLEENQKRLVRAYAGIEPDAKTVLDKKGNNTFIDTHHGVAAVLQEELRRLETERMLAQQVHEEYRKRLQSEIAEDPKKFMTDQA